MHKPNALYKRVNFETEQAWGFVWSLFLLSNPLPRNLKLEIIDLFFIFYCLRQWFSVYCRWSIWLDCSAVVWPCLKTVAFGIADGIMLFLGRNLHEVGNSLYDLFPNGNSIRVIVQIHCLKFLYLVDNYLYKCFGNFRSIRSFDAAEKAQLSYLLNYLKLKLCKWADFRCTLISAFNRQCE